MKFKLANGNVVASTKQPLQNKDFDRIEISDDYDGTALEDCIPESGDIEFEVSFFNPSTHTVQQSTTGNYFFITVGTKVIGNSGSGWSPKIYSTNSIKIGGGPCAAQLCVQRLDLKNIDYGYTTTTYFYPLPFYTRASYSKRVMPINTEVWDDGDIQNYHHSNFEYEYSVDLRQAGHHKGKTKHKKIHIINYKVFK